MTHQILMVQNWFLRMIRADPTLDLYDLEVVLDCLDHDPDWDMGMVKYGTDLLEQYTKCSDEEEQILMVIGVLEEKWKRPMSKAWEILKDHKVSTEYLEETEYGSFEGYEPGEYVTFYNMVQDWASYLSSQ